MSDAHTYTLTEDEVEQFLTGIVSGDNDGVREDEDERERDRVAGDWGEAALHRHFSEHLDDDKWEHVPDDEVDGEGWEYDFRYFTDCGKAATIDVKARQMWLDGTPDEEPDMLVRFDDSNEPRTHAHIYYVVELHGSGVDDIEDVVVKGFADEETVALADEFFHGDVFKTLVPQSEMPTISSLEIVARSAVTTCDIRGGHECMFQRMLNAEHADHDEEQIRENHDLQSCHCRSAKQHRRETSEVEA